MFNEYVKGLQKLYERATSIFGSGSFTFEAYIDAVAAQLGLVLVILLTLLALFIIFYGAAALHAKLYYVLGNKLFYRLRRLTAKSILSECRVAYDIAINNQDYLPENIYRKCVTKFQELAKEYEIDSANVNITEAEQKKITVDQKRCVWYSTVPNILYVFFYVILVAPIPISFIPATADGHIGCQIITVYILTGMFSALALWRALSKYDLNFDIVAYPHYLDKSELYDIIEKQKKKEKKKEKKSEV